MKGWLKSFGTAGIAAGQASPCMIAPGERPWFLSTVGGAGGGTIIWNNTTITVPAGVAFTRGGDDWPKDCEDWHVAWQVVFTGALAETFFEWGPL